MHVMKIRIKMMMMITSRGTQLMSTISRISGGEGERGRREGGYECRRRSHKLTVV